MSSSNFQLPPEIPQEEERREDRHEERRRSRSSRSSFNTTSRKNHSAKHKGFKPGRLLQIAWGLLGIGVVSTVAINVFGSHSTRYITGTDYEYSSDLPDSISAEPVMISKPSDNTVMVTFHLTKDDPTVAASIFADLEIQGDEEYGEIYNFAHIKMGYGLDDVYTSVVTTSSSFKGVDAEDIDVHVEYELSYESTLYDYEYYLNDGEEVSYDNIMKHYLENHPEANGQIEIVHDGVSEQNGVVQYRFGNDIEQSIYGSVNIVYKNAGEVVFGAIEDCEASTTQRTFVYSTPVPIGPYDEVEIHYLME